MTDTRLREAAEALSDIVGQLLADPDGTPPHYCESILLASDALRAALDSTPEPCPGDGCAGCRECITDEERAIHPDDLSTMRGTDR